MANIGQLWKTMSDGFKPCQIGSKYSHLHEQENKIEFVLMKELVSKISSFRECVLSVEGGKKFFIDATNHEQVAIGDVSEDGDRYEIFGSVEAALNGFTVNGKPIAQLNPAIEKAQPIRPIPLVD